MARYEIDKEFRQKLDGRRLEPDARVWEAISAHLDDTPKTKPGKKTFWWKYASVAVVFIALSIPFLQTNQEYGLSGPKVTEQPASEMRDLKKRVQWTPFIKPPVRSKETIFIQEKSAALVAEVSPEAQNEPLEVEPLTPEIAAPVIQEAAAPVSIPKPNVVTGAKVHPRTLLASVDENTKAPQTNWVREMEQRYQSLRAVVAQRNIEEHQ